MRQFTMPKHEPYALIRIAAYIGDRLLALYSDGLVVLMSSDGRVITMTAQFTSTRAHKSHSIATDDSGVIYLWTQSERESDGRAVLSKVFTFIP